MNPGAEILCNQDLEYTNILCKVKSQLIISYSHDYCQTSFHYRTFQKLGNLISLLFLLLNSVQSKLTTTKNKFLNVIRHSKLSRSPGREGKSTPDTLVCGSFQPDQEKACNICPFQRFQYFPKN
jgi:hypothetical protein